MNQPERWYSDPEDATLERWWNGAQWTHHTRPSQNVQTPPPPQARTVPPPPQARVVPQPPQMPTPPQMPAITDTPVARVPSVKSPPPQAPSPPAASQDAQPKPSMFRRKRQVETETNQPRAGSSPTSFVDATPQSVVADGLDGERERWLQFARSEFDDMVAEFDNRRAELQAEMAALESQIVDDNEVLYLQEMGVLREGDHPAASSIEYKHSIDRARSTRKEMAKRKDAVLGSTSWQVNGSLSEGRKMVEQFSKLMLRAYNSELDSLIKKTNASNSAKQVSTLGKKRDQIKKLGQSMNIEIAHRYHDQAVYEIRQTGLFQYAKQLEKEEERARREQLREQKKVEQEIKKEQDKLDKEATLHRQALEALEANPDASAGELELLRAKLAEVEAAQNDVFKRAANTRAGHVYVISNPGSFGPGVVKIGMTRRLDPMDRVVELGDASVPFRFSVHAIMFSDDAVSLETELHQHFEPRRINRINRRKEFFRATPREVLDALQKMNAHVVEFDEEPVNDEWMASQ